MRQPRPATPKAERETKTLASLSLPSSSVPPITGRAAGKKTGERWSSGQIPCDREQSPGLALTRMDQSSQKLRAYMGKWDLRDKE